jgi:hypothetical protein
MEKFLNVLASGARSLSFTPTMEIPEFDDEPLPFSKPRTPAEVMQSVWADVGKRMWIAIGEVEEEYGEQLTK